MLADSLKNIRFEFEGKRFEGDWFYQRLFQADCCLIGKTDTATALSEGIAVMAVGQIGKAYAALGVGPGNLSAGAVVAESFRAIEVAKASQVAVFVACDNDA